MLKSGEGAKLSCKRPWHFRRQDSDRRETVTHRGRGEVEELGVWWGVNRSVKVGLQGEGELGGKEGAGLEDSPLSPTHTVLLSLAGSLCFYWQFSS